jgi:soluble lytic murein transglycosylase-like protein
MLRSQLGTWRHIYLAAYNMGPNAAVKFLKRKKMPVNYSSKVLNHYMNFYMDLRASLEMASAKTTKVAFAE